MSILYIVHRYPERVGQGQRGRRQTAEHLQSVVPIAPRRSLNANTSGRTVTTQRLMRSLGRNRMESEWVELIYPAPSSNSADPRDGIL